MANKTYAIPAMGAGHFGMMGAIAAAGAMRLDVPEGILNIGGNGKGYVLPPLVDWDPTAIGNQDGSLDGLAVGDDVYLYAVQGADGRAGLVASTNITVPGGYTAATSRKIGGFHYGRVRTVADRYNKAIVPSVQIVPNSVWDLGHRPKCDPTGMVEVIPGRLWADIYLNSQGSGAWPETIPVSRFGVMPLSGAEGYSRYLDLPVLAANAGKRLPTLDEFYVYADGTPEGNDANNDTAWSATTNTDRAATGTVAKAVSCLGIVDAAGNLWEPMLGLYDQTTSTWEWDRTILQNGKDSAELRGELYHQRWRFWLAGGRFVSGVRCGSRCAHSATSPESVASYAGLRCVCDSL
ncbi:SUMF1/EgtB/PvdO family nonheme iron enzyme [Chromohalobacter phage YPCBV-1]|nr:SUMF1/EgtB/PvdO family nonheme iron enzyme [Chromohalobacter phage YPCBV-1]